jgi:hypothetical protein
MGIFLQSNWNEFHSNLPFWRIHKLGVYYRPIVSLARPTVHPTLRYDSSCHLLPWYQMVLLVFLLPEKNVFERINLGKRE